MISGDGSVAIAATVVATHNWWDDVLQHWIPDGAQTLIILFTLVYVLFRAANEAKKFYGLGEKRGNDE